MGFTLFESIRAYGLVAGIKEYRNCVKLHNMYGMTFMPEQR